MTKDSVLSREISIPTATAVVVANVIGSAYVTVKIPSRSRSMAVGLNTVFSAPSPATCPGSRMIGNEGKPDRAKSLALTPPIAIFVMFRLQVPVFEMGKGFKD